MLEDLFLLFKILCGVAKRLERLKRDYLWEWFDDVNGSYLASLSLFSYENSSPVRFTAP